jgi:hypothetical protein
MAAANDSGLIFKNLWTLLVHPCFLCLSDMFCYLLTGRDGSAVNPVIELLNETPSRLERTIGAMEKQARVLEKEGAAALASATEMTLQEIISKLK